MSRWKGTCVTAPDFPSSSCNCKIIRARAYFKRYESHIGRLMDKSNESKSPIDTEGHMTHTTSTVAGSPVVKVSLFTYAQGEARGMATKARIVVYKICWSFGCFDSDILAAMDQAIADDIDIISFSIGANDVILGDNRLFGGVSLYSGEPLVDHQLPLIYGGGLKQTGAFTPTDLDIDHRITEFNIISGTSMSCLHMGGIATLLRKAYLNWSIAAIKSALIITTYTLDDSGKKIRDLATGKESIPFVHGARHVDLNRALNLSLSSPGDLNYPSFSIILSSDQSLVKYKRVVTNVGSNADAVYKVNVTAQIGVEISVSPSELVFNDENQS
ncbi:hypothetical protein FF1_024716 [Malus domestica]